MMRALFLPALLGVLASAPSSASAEPRPAIARIRATSASARAHLAMDANANTAWCPEAGDPRGELVLRFAAPVTLKALRLFPGRWSDTTRLYRPSRVEVQTETVHATFEPVADERVPWESDEVRGQRVTQVGVRLPPAAPGLQRCISELQLDLEEGPWVQDLPDAAVEALPESIRALTQAFRACDVSALRSRVRLPLPRRERQVGHADAELWYVQQPARFYKSARALARDCRQWVFPADETPPREPKVVAGIGPALIRVEAHREAGVVYWHLGWHHGRWWLVGIESTRFE